MFFSPILGMALDRNAKHERSAIGIFQKDRFAIADRKFNDGKNRYIFSDLLEIHLVVI